MDTISLYYFQELAKELHVTNTASRLFISQQTLSNHIKRLEDELGTALFYRKPAFRLTPAGEHVLQYATKMLLEQKNLTDSLSDYSDESRGIIRFGASNLRMNTVFPKVAGPFTKRYPNVSFRLTEALGSQLIPSLENGDLDLAILPSTTNSSLLTEQHLLDDTVYLCVSNSLLNQYYGEASTAIKVRSLRGVDLADFTRLPFCMLENRLGRQINDAARAKGIELRIYQTSELTQICTTIGKLGLAACFVTHTELAAMDIPEDWNIFPVKNNNVLMTQKMKLVFHKERYIPQYTKYFAELICAFYENARTTHLKRFVRY